MLLNYSQRVQFGSEVRGPKLDPLCRLLICISILDVLDAFIILSHASLFLYLSLSLTLACRPATDYVFSIRTGMKGDLVYILVIIEIIISFVISISISIAFNIAISSAIGVATYYYDDCYDYYDYYDNHH